ncbi:MAG TPA: restriction endonuclease subunit S [Candidatus Woesebacteria bacterium]|nr:restriction endonuclease subunit S [Candidatus Woesebacteria bacterium]
MITQKVFTDELEGRIDPNYYHPRFVSFFGKLRRGKYNLVNLSEITKTIFQGVGKNETKDNDITLLKVKNITQESRIDYEDVEYVKGVPASKLLETKDIISPFIGEATRLGKFAIFDRNDNKYTVDNNTGVIRADKTKVLPEYLLTVLSSEIGKIQIERLIGGGGVPFLGAGNAKLLQIPLPTIEKQREIALILQNALQSKKEKLKQADELLNSIDDFVRQQLGIDYQEPEEEKIYTVNSQDIENNRQDPYYYKPNFVNLEKVLLENKAVKLRELIKTITNGLDYRKFSEDGTMDYLRVSNIKPYKIDYTEVKKVKLSQSDIRKNIFGAKDDVLLTRKGTYGISVSLEENLSAIISSEVFLLKVYTEKINPHYLSVFFNSSLGQKQFLRNKVGAIMGSLSQEAVRDTLIVLPSEAKQTSIVNQVRSQIRKSDELKQEAEAIVTKAKKQVEAMILN